MYSATSAPSRVQPGAVQAPPVATVATSPVAASTVTRSKRPRRAREAAIRSPSGDQASPAKSPASAVSWRASVPSGRTRCTSFQPERSEVKAIQVPSGDHAGPRSAMAGSSESVCTSPLATSTTQISIARRSSRRQKT